MTDTLTTFRGATDRLAVGKRAWSLLVAVCLAAAILIETLVVDISSPHLARDLAIMCALGIVAALVVWRFVLPGGEMDRPAVRPQMADLRLAVPPAVVGLGCAAWSAHLVATDGWDAQWLWLAGMAIPLLALAGIRVYRLWGHATRLPSIGRREAGAVAALFIVALALRAVNITASPPFLLGDESSCGLYGRVFNAGHTPLLSISWFGLPMLSYAISGLGLTLFGDNFTGLRMINAVIGAGSVVLIYLLGKEWFGRRAGALAAIFLTFTFLHLELSRNGIHYLQGPTVITLSLYLSTIWIKRGGILSAYLTGLTFALAIQVYWSARVAPLLVAGLLGFLLLRDRQLLFARWREIGWMVLGAVIGGWPVAALFAANPGTFNGHQTQIMILNSDPGLKGHLVSEYGNVGMLDIVRQQLWKVLTTFNARSDSSAVFEWTGKPLLDTVSAALLPAAVALALLRWKRWEYTVCLAWFGAIVAASTLTIDPPDWPRLFAVVPAVALLLGVFLADVWAFFELRVRPRLVVAVALLGIMGIGAGENLHEAFVHFPAVSRQYAMAPTYLGNFLNHAPGASNTVLLSDGGYYLSYESVRFLAPHAGGCTLMPGQAVKTCPGYKTSRLFVLQPGRLKDLPALERQKPGGKVVQVATYDYGASRIVAYELP
jgi:hypothetical protein